MQRAATHSLQVLEAILDDDQDMQDMYLARRAEMAEMIAPNLDMTQPPPNAPLAFLPSVSTSGRAENALSEALQSVAASQDGRQTQGGQTDTTQGGVAERQQSELKDFTQRGSAQQTTRQSLDTGQANGVQRSTTQEEQQVPLQQAVTRMNEQWAERQHQTLLLREEEAELAEDNLAEHPLSLAVPDQVSPTVLLYMPGWMLSKAGTKNQRHWAKGRESKMKMRAGAEVGNGLNSERGIAQEESIA